ncbi:MAG TPA: phosphatase PAP2 family protein [Spirochaetia bacterium]|nr:phosphatase PAP2 family protein [Spirochaetia bacterium]
MRLRRLFGRGIFATGWINAGGSILLAAGVFFASKIYDPLNHGPAVLHLRTPLDDAIPLVPLFVIPYDSLEPVIYFSLIVFLIFRTRIFQSAALSVIVAMLVSYLVYFLAQSEVIRPVVSGADLFSGMIRDVYAGDNPYNDFPSLHTSLSTIMAIHWWRADRRLGVIGIVWAALIVSSTLFVKQHYVADVVSGLLLAWGASWLSRKVLRPESLNEQAT